MDPLTHATLGVAVAMAVAPTRHRRAAALAGLAAGLLPDADIFIRSAEDPLLSLEYHRHFTHSFLFQPVTAILAATLAWLLLRRGVPWKALLLPGLAAGLSHVCCDAWTSYGTRLWWPFADTRVAWDLASIIDPLITLPLLLAVILALFRPARRLLPIAGLAWTVLYLGVAIVQRERAEATLRNLAAERGHSIDRLTAKPSFANILVWRGIYQSGNTYHATAIRPGWQDVEVIPGEKLTVFRPGIDAAHFQETRQGRDLARFAHFSDHWLARVPRTNRWTIGDMRYAMLPQSMHPLWGIVLDPDEMDAPVRMASFRTIEGNPWSKLWALVTGEAFRRSELPGLTAGGHESKPNSHYVIMLRSAHHNVMEGRVRAWRGGFVPGWESACFQPGRVVPHFPPRACGPLPPPAMVVRTAWTTPFTTLIRLPSS